MKNEESRVNSQDWKKWRMKIKELRIPTFHFISFTPTHHFAVVGTQRQDTRYQTLNKTTSFILIHFYFLLIFMIISHFLYFLGHNYDNFYQLEKIKL